MSFDLERPPSNAKRNLVLIIAALGFVTLAVAAVVVLQSRGSAAGGSTLSAGAGVKQWCDLRREWDKKIKPMGSDIMLQSVQDKAAAATLSQERNQTCQAFGKRLNALRVDDPGVLAVERALIKEGKVRANISVEIENLLTELGAREASSLRKAKGQLEEYIKIRISAGRKKADREVGDAMVTISNCKGIYRGPASDAGTADDPYVSWDELDFRRTAAIKAFDRKLKQVAPREAFTNKVHAALVKKYRSPLIRCYRKYKKKNAQLSPTMGLRVRLKRSGEVQSLAIEWMTVRDDRILDPCLLRKAHSWKLPRPQVGGDFVVVTLDFSKL